MAVLKRHNPAVEGRLKSLISAGDIVALRTYVMGLNNTEFRTAGYLLSDVILPTLDGATYWKVFSILVPTNSKAFLGTFLKAAVYQFKAGTLTLSRETLSNFAAVATNIDKRKTLEALLPVMWQAEEVHLLLDLFCGGNLKSCLAFLVNQDTVACYFELFRQMKQLEGQTEDLQHYTMLMMRKGTKRAFNMAAIVKAYFGLDTLPGTFSLHLEAYQLSRLDSSYEAFCHLLNN